MTDHAGPRRCECHPGTNLWHPPIEVTKFWHQGAVWRPFFVRPTKIILIKKRGKVWSKSCWKWSKLLFCFILMNWFLFGPSKTQTGAKTAPRVPNLGYFDGRVPKFSSRLTLTIQRRTPAWSVICHPLPRRKPFEMKSITNYDWPPLGSFYTTPTRLHHPPKIKVFLRPPLSLKIYIQFALDLF